VQDDPRSPISADAGHSGAGGDDLCWLVDCSEALNATGEADRQVRGGNVLDNLFHPNIEKRDWAWAIDTFGSTISHVHIPENDRGAPGRGHIGFISIFKALRRIAYDGWLTVGVFGHALPDIATVAKACRPLFGPEEGVFSGGFSLIRRSWHRT